jgi:hypothetical protein
MKNLSTENAESNVSSAFVGNSCHIKKTIFEHFMG